MSVQQAASVKVGSGHSAWSRGPVGPSGVGVAIGEALAGGAAGGAQGAAFSASLAAPGASDVLDMSVGAEDDGGPVLTGSADVFLGREMRPAARAGQDGVDCRAHGHQAIRKGSATVIVNGFPLARSLDEVGCGSLLGDVSVSIAIGGPPIDTAPADRDPPPGSGAEAGVAVGSALAGGARLVDGIDGAKAADAMLQGFPAGPVVNERSFTPRGARDRRGRAASATSDERGEREAAARAWFGAQTRRDPRTGERRSLGEAEIHVALKSLDLSQPVSVVEHDGVKTLHASPARLDDFWTICGAAP